MALRTIILAAGGTGGHIFPAEALAEVLLARGYQPVLITDHRFHQYHKGSSDSVLARIPIHTIHAGSLSGSPLTVLKNGIMLLRGVFEALAQIRKLDPVAVVGFGGYPSFPTMVAGVLLRRITVIHEQNSVLGKVNRLLAPYVKSIAATYSNMQQLPEAVASRVTVTGNPVRSAIRALSGLDYPALAEGGMMRILVTGGSQGASVFSEVLPAAMRLLSVELRARIRLDQQVRAGEIDAVRAQYEAMGMQVDLAPFFTDVAARLAAAHLVIARSGASTMAELMVAGRPAMLVPLPTATDNHQYYNAQSVEDSGAGWVIPQEAFTPQVLATRIETLLRTPQRLSEAAATMRGLAKPSAADELAGLVLAVSG